MSRILLVDDSPHAQRMGERILSEEGFEVVTVSNADSALIRMDDVDPDVVLADTVMPGRTGFDICHYLKMSPRHRHVRVILTAGVLEPLDEANAQRVEADGTLKKPFEASALIAAVKPLAEAAVAARTNQGADAAKGAASKGDAPTLAASMPPFVAVIDAEQVRAAVTVALDACMAKMVDEITSRVLAAIGSKKPDIHAMEVAPPPAVRLAAAGQPQPAAPQPVIPRVEPIRRVTPVRLRSSSILGLEIDRPEPGPPDTPAPHD